MAGNPLLSMMGGNNPIANMMQNNPVMQMVNMLKNGKNPQAFVQQMMGQNPQFGQMVNSLNGKDQSQVNDMISNLAKEKGVDLHQLVNQLGVPEDVVKNLGIE